ncbi:MAG: hypothetical protein NT028_06965, partial [candidate division Zixibacteria bacterium]|nr:hypothetical protein [candidate division Zixibacteria bacterium]
LFLSESFLRLEASLPFQGSRFLQGISRLLCRISLLSPVQESLAFSVSHPSFVDENLVAPNLSGSDCCVNGIGAVRIPTCQTRVQDICANAPKKSILKQNASLPIYQLSDPVDD